MPSTQPEIDNIKGQIEQAQTLRYERKGSFLMPVLQGEPTADSLGWGDLADGEVQGVLASLVNFEGFGFSPEEELDVISRVAAGQEPSEWFDGVERVPEDMAALFAEWREDYALRIAPEPASPTAEEAIKPRNHGTYQVWRDGNHAFDVESVAVHKAEELTARPGWEDDPSVTFHGDDRRPIQLGDVVVDPTCGAWEIQEDGYQAVKPPPEVAERMGREGIVPQHVELLGRWLTERTDFDRQLNELSERRIPANDNELEALMYTWCTMSTRDRRVQEVDCWPTLDEALASMAKQSWENTSRRLVDWISNEAGEVVAVSIYGPELKLLVACSDGRRLEFEVPEYYKDRHP